MSPDLASLLRFLGLFFMVVGVLLGIRLILYGLVGGLLAILGVRLILLILSGLGIRP